MAKKKKNARFSRILQANEVNEAQMLATLAYSFCFIFNDVLKGPDLLGYLVTLPYHHLLPKPKVCTVGLRLKLVH